MALASTVYAANVSAEMGNACADAEETPVNFPDGGDGHPYKATNQFDCCTTACIVANPGNSEGANTCTANCITY
jgi:hypothetical protein